MIRAGSKVVFSGYPFGDHKVGDEGLVLDVPSRTHVYVRWTTGARTGQIDLVRATDLNAAMAGRDPIVARHRMSEEHLGLWSADLSHVSGSLDDYEGWD